MKRAAGVSRARMYLRRDLGWVQGFPIGQNQWLELAPSAPARTIELDRKPIRNSTRTIDMLLREFPRGSAVICGKPGTNLENTMDEQTRQTSSELDTGQWTELSKAIERFEEAIGADPAVSPAEFLPPPEHPLRRHVLVELIKISQESSWRSTEPRLLESYLQEWPELSADLNRFSQTE